MENRGYGFGTFKGVFTPSILTIIGVVMYLRFGWVLGSVGLTKTLIIVTVSSAITFLTGLSVSALATNMRVKGGGAYFMVSRSFGVEVGAAIGIPLFLSQAIAVAFYVAGFAEAFVLAFPGSGIDMRFAGLVTLGVLSLVATYSADWALKSQYVIMAFIAASLVSFFCGSPLPVEETAETVKEIEKPGFWHVLAVFFPAVTGILSGVGMSGDLKKPSVSLPLGTIAAVLTGWAVYMLVPVFLHYFVADESVLMNDAMVMQKCARVEWLIIAGVWAATLSSALGSLLAAPRIVQALAVDGALPSFLGKGFGKNNDPRLASILAISLAAAGIWFGNINILAPILTIFNLTAYALLNLSSGFEEFMGNPAWRPSFRVPAVLSFLGFAGCLSMMFMISPGATIVAVLCIVLVWWAMSRRSMHSRWGDMRTGLLFYLIHALLRRLLKRRSLDAHAWRPNLLVLTGAPNRRLKIVDFVRGVLGPMSFATFGVVLPFSSWTARRGKELSEAMHRWLVRHGVDAQIRVHPAENTLRGRMDLVRAYGYGPLEPNTVLLGEMSDMETAEMMFAISQMKKNVIFMRSEKGLLLPSKGKGVIDVWWRGKSMNASFVLAFAYLLQYRHFGKTATLRLCHLIEGDEKPENVTERMIRFLKETRVRAEVSVVPMSDRDPYEEISRVSEKSDLVFLGLRVPRVNETVGEYGGYLASVRAKTRDIPQAVFAAAAEDIDFKGLFL